MEALRSRPQLPHALLIHGPRGVGKLALAERLAQLILCEAQGSARPCGACEGCRWYLAGNHPDFRRVEPEAFTEAQAETGEGDEPAPAPARKGKPSQDIRIDQVRELADFLNIGSHRARARIALVHPAEAMNAVAQNGLLKSLEEPPPGAMFLLVSHHPARLLPTLRSRCQSVAVPLPPLEAALAWMTKQGAKDPARWLAYAGGAPLRALEYAAQADMMVRLHQALSRGTPVVIDDRESLQALAEALQKIALDQSMAALGLPAKFQTGLPKPSLAQAKAWLAFARSMGERRALSRHPVNPRLFAAEMLAALPSNAKS